MFDRRNQPVVRPGVRLISRAGFEPSEIREKTVVLTNAQLLALRATPVEVVPAPGVGKFVEFISAVAIFDRTAAYTETAANFAFRFNNGTGTTQATIESTGFVDAAGDAVTFATPAAAPNVTAAGELSNASLVVHNNGAGEFGGGNAANAITLVVAYRVHKTNL